ncbi:MAG: energy-coupling factor transporter transmembrane protein EcfT [Firmicutes bacterium]|nr:energy-coupling factor transporter transmembrane protein EcfT [Bacillota bacterium]
MREMTFGQYYPAESVIHKLDPRLKIVLTLAYIVTIFFVNNFLAFGVVFIFLLSLVFLSSVPIRMILKAVRPIMYIIIFTAILNLFWGVDGTRVWNWWFITIYREALFNTALLMLRLMFLVMGPALLTLTTTPMDLTDGIERLLSPLKVVRFPVHELALVMSIALRFIPILMEETDKIIKAQKSRGANFDSGNIFKRAAALIPILIPLFVSAFRRAEELALAMDSRCYKGGKGRTRMKLLKFSLTDFLAVLGFIIFVLCIVAIRVHFMHIIPVH